ncbi:MAG: class I SAM-dependent methyltransferase [Chloroflexi bacterium]|nr:class I SAM-dependent methyltransferase [Chloroflexota bacterium]
MIQNDNPGFRRLQRTWEAFGKDDPMFAILSVQDKRRGRWDRQEFFESGLLEIRSVMAYLTSVQLKPANGMALDFGCGIGRLTQALADYFDKCTGVDIAPSMISLAHEYNNNKARCEYVLNENADLRIFEDYQFDFVYCSKVLQHMEPAYSANYISEFVRVLNTDGVLVFQLPSERLNLGGETRAEEIVRGVLRRAMPTPLLEYYRSKRYGSSANMDMHHVSRDQVESIIRRSGGRLVDVVDDGASGPAYVSLRYCVVKT